MHSKDSLGTFLMEDEMHFNIATIELIDYLLQHKYFGQKEFNANELKPIQLMPILNLQRDIEKLSKAKDREIGENSLHYISDVTVYLNNQCAQKCEFCNSYDKQFLHCYSESKSNELIFNNLIKASEQLKSSTLRRLIFTGSNVLEYSKLIELASYLTMEKLEAEFAFHYLNIDFEKVKILESFKKIVFVDIPVHTSILGSLLKNLNNELIKISFSVKSSEEYEQVYELIRDLNIGNYAIHPFYDFSNLDFFSENIFTEESDIFERPIEFRRIFSNQKLNTNFFGQLFILPDGNAKSNLSERIIGNINEETIVNIAGNELLKNTSWCNIRDDSPCNDCFYQFLCPSPSN